MMDCSSEQLAGCVSTNILNGTILTNFCAAITAHGVDMR